jgi:acetamidase/formamidase
MDVTLRLSVRRDFSVDTPHYDVPAGAVAAHEQSAYHVCTGVAPDLMEAARQAVRETVAFLGTRYGLDRNEAYAVASVAVDLRIHEVVDAPNWVVGAFIPESIFAGGM